MAVDVFDLKAVLSLDDSPFVKGLSRASSSANSFSSGLAGVGNMIANVSAIAAGAFIGIGVLGIYNAAKDESSLAQLKVALTDAQDRAQTAFSNAAAASNQFHFANNDSAKDIIKLQGAVKSAQESLEHAQFVWDNATKKVKGHTEASHANGVALAWAKQQYDEATAALANATGQHQVWTGDLTKALPVMDLTMTNLKSMAKSFEDESTTSHVAIQDIEASFLRYGVTSSDVMAKSVSAVLDLAAATGDSLPAAAMKLGETYKNPAAELTRLQALGIIFSAQMVTQVKQMTAAGDSAGAYNVILKALDDTYGGAAAAAADTFNGRLQQAQNAFNDLTESVGNIFLPILKQLLDSFTTFIDSLSPEQVDLFAKSVIAITVAFTGLFVIGKITSMLSLFGTTILPILGPIAVLLAGVTGAIAILSGASGTAGGILDNLVTAVQNVFNSIKADLGPIAQDIQNFFAQIQSMPTETFTPSGPAKQYKGIQRPNQPEDEQLPQKTVQRGEYKFVSPFDNIIQAIKDNSGKFISDAGNLVRNAISSFLSGLNIQNTPGYKLISKILDSINTNIIQPVSQGIQDLANTINSLDWTGFDSIANGIIKFGAGVLQSGLIFLGPLLKGALDGLGSIIKAIADALAQLSLGSIPGALKDLQPVIEKVTLALLGFMLLTGVAGIISGIAAAVGLLNITAGPLLLLVGAVYVLVRALTDFEGLAKDLGLSQVVDNVRASLQSGLIPVLRTLMQAFETLLQMIAIVENFTGSKTIADIYAGFADQLAAQITALNNINTSPSGGGGDGQTPATATPTGQGRGSGGPGTRGYGASHIPQASSGQSINTVHNNISIQVNGVDKTTSQMFDEWMYEAKRRNMNI